MAAAFTQAVVERGHHNCFGDAGYTEQDLLDLDGTDVFPATDYDVGFAPVIVR